jgi:hypothetical protein
VRRRLVVAVVSLAVAAVPAVVLACPYCIGKDPVLPTSLKLVGLFLLVPFVVFATVATIARRLR